MILDNKVKKLSRILEILSINDAIFDINKNGIITNLKSLVITDSLGLEGELLSDTFPILRADR